MRRVVLVLALLLAACSESGGEKSEDKSKRPIGMSEEIWKIYGGVESGVGADKSEDKKDPPTEKK